MTYWQTKTSAKIHNLHLNKLAYLELSTMAVGQLNYLMNNCQLKILSDTYANSY